MTNSQDQNTNSNVNQQNLEKELKEIKNQYTLLAQELENVKKNDKKINSLQESMQSMQEEFEDINETLQEISQMSKTMQDITDKLNNLTANQQKRKGMGMMPRNAFRKGIVRTLSSALTVVDMTVEKMSMAKEGIEDIVAEAQYENKKRRMDPRMSSMSEMYTE
ncbi:hypothetical protein [Clostridium formicaceticum]|uniref:Uncharacterized protein n=1 Tax=Clostridium formicaceticum TaxID=1497 RepID=A0AAC9WH90_9CLOT|nr:hypothetical protein [Clostridium formicaceticum]AOY74516.1 hypothetical protein BJL90_00235 [Clostridium formicaceticum]ARE88872.1 hypothetical protein CLFO_32780 [Clostridium formicaceticum]